MSVVIKWNPAHNIFMLDEAISQLMGEASDFLRAAKSDTRAAWTPVADMYETDDAIIIHVELAGIEKNSLEILFQEGYVVVRGERSFNPDMQSAKIHRIERMYGKFQRMFWIPGTVDTQHISASYNQGVLQVVLAKLQNTNSDRIKVSVTFQ